MELAARKRLNRTDTGRIPPKRLHDELSEDYRDMIYADTAAEIDEEAWESLYSDTSRPFPKPKSGRIAVKVINHLGDEVMKVFAVE